MLWLYLLGIVTVLIIALRRVIRRMLPLKDELYSKNVAIDHVYSGVAWVDAEGKLGSVNPALARTLEIEQNDLIGHEWVEIFAPSDRDLVRDAYSQMLLAGKASFAARGYRANGTYAWFDVMLVAVHDHKTRFVGHHCLAEDRTREHELKVQVDQLTHSNGR